MTLKIGLLIITLAMACHTDEHASSDPEAPGDTANEAQVLSVRTSGDPMNYLFDVEVKSPDTGCDQYANWWEVVTEDAELIYRRILAHSHVNEQPFRRSGGPVKINPDQRVLIRVHMNNAGYSSKVLKGSINQGFKPQELEKDFGSNLAKQEPLPGDCPN